MYSVKGTTITLTRGDTFEADITIKAGSETYTPSSSDSIRFAVARAPEIDQANSIVKRAGKLYSIEIEGAVRGMYADFFSRYNSIMNA